MPSDADVLGLLKGGIIYKGGTNHCGTNQCGTIARRYFVAQVPGRRCAVTLWPMVLVLLVVAKASVCPNSRQFLIAAITVALNGMWHYSKAHYVAIVPVAR